MMEHFWATQKLPESRGQPGCGGHWPASGYTRAAVVRSPRQPGGTRVQTTSKGHSSPGCLEGGPGPGWGSHKDPLGKLQMEAKN